MIVQAVSLCTFGLFISTIMVEVEPSLVNFSAELRIQFVKLDVTGYFRSFIERAVSRNEVVSNLSNY